jgi:hypothetical protein
MIAKVTKSGILLIVAISMTCSASPMETAWMDPPSPGCLTPLPNDIKETIIGHVGHDYVRNLKVSRLWRNSVNERFPALNLQKQEAIDEFCAGQAFFQWRDVRFLQMSLDMSQPGLAEISMPCALAVAEICSHEIGIAITIASTGLRVWQSAREALWTISTSCALDVTLDLLGLTGEAKENVDLGFLAGTCPNVLSMHGFERMSQFTSLFNLLDDCKDLESLTVSESAYLSYPPELNELIRNQRRMIALRLHHLNIDDGIEDLVWPPSLQELHLSDVKVENAEKLSKVISGLHRLRSFVGGGLDLGTIMLHLLKSLSGLPNVKELQLIGADLNGQMDEELRLPPNVKRLVVIRSHLGTAFLDAVIHHSQSWDYIKFHINEVCDEEKYEEFVRLAETILVE